MGIWLAIVGVIIDHQRVIASKLTKSCTMENGPLRQEAMWLQYLAAFLTAKLVIFIPWYLILLLSKRVTLESDDQPTQTPTPHLKLMNWYENSNEKEKEEESPTDSYDQSLSETLLTEASFGTLTSTHSERLEFSMIKKHPKQLSDHTVVFGDTTWK